MLRFQRLALPLLGLGLLGGASTEAAAQGFFESLFGGGSPSPVVQPRPSMPPPAVSPYGYRAPPFVPYRAREQGIDDNPLPEKSGRYRTVCVRLCDGYYWPISFATTRASFYRDANSCRASCGEEARLFFHAANEGDTSEMVDLTGRAYARLSTAYRYRKTMIEGCKCKPEPWAVSELDRHRRYAQSDIVEERWRKDRVAATEEAIRRRGDAPVAGTDRVAEEETPVAATVDPEEVLRREIGRPEPEERPGPKAKRVARGDVRGPAATKPGPQFQPVRAAAPKGVPAPFGLGGPAKKSGWPGD